MRAPFSFLRIGLLGLLAVLHAAPAGAQGACPEFQRELQPFQLIDGLGYVPNPFQGGWKDPRPQLVDIDADGDLDLFVLEELGKLRFYRNVGTPAAHSWSFETDDYFGLHEFFYSRFVDVDGDGDQDVLCETLPFDVGGVFKGGAVLYTNVGTPAAPVYQNLSTHEQGYFADEIGAPIAIDLTTPDFLDLDGDGDLDLGMGDPSGRVIVYENVGPPGAPSFRFLTNSYGNLDIRPGACNPSRAPEAAGGKHGFMLFSFWDVNGDLFPDMFVGDAFNENVYFYQNTGIPAQTPNFACQSEEFFPAAGGGLGIFGQRILASFGDLDADGDPDAVFGSGSSHSLGLHFYRNAGTPSFPLFVQEESSWIPEFDLGADTQPVFANLDGDQDPDLYLGAITQQAISRWENISADPALPEFGLVEPTWIQIANTDWIAAEPADIDDDGDLDMLIGGEAGEIQLFRNDLNGPDSASFSEDTSRADFGDRPDRLFRLSIDSQATPRAFDGDGDGDLDLLVGYFENQSPQSAPLFYFRNDGTPQDPAFVLASSDYQGLGLLGQGTAPALGDLDGDGDPDLLVGRLDGGIAFLRNVGTPSYPAFVRETDDFEGIDVGARAFPALSDLDADGDLDLVVGESGGGLNYYRNVTAPDPVPTSFALTEPAPDAGIAGRRAVPFRWEPSLVPGSGAEVSGYELRLAPAPDARPSEWTVIPTSSNEALVRLYSQGFSQAEEVWWTVVAVEGCRTGPVPDWRRAIHTTVDSLHQEPGFGEPISLTPEDPEFSFAITNAYPSPSMDRTTVAYTLPWPGNVRVTVHDAAGRTVAVLRDGARGAGEQAETWDGATRDGVLAGPGIYVIRVEFENSVLSRRIARLR